MTTNNTSSTFTLPSEFKKLWDELVTELILDAFPDFLDHYTYFTAFSQEAFIMVKELILEMKSDITRKIAQELNLEEDNKEVLG